MKYKVSAHKVLCCRWSSPAAVPCLSLQGFRWNLSLASLNYWASSSLPQAVFYPKSSFLAGWHHLQISIKPPGIFSLLWFHLFSFKAHIMSSNCICTFGYLFFVCLFYNPAAAAAAKSLQSCLTLCDPIGGSSLGSLVLGILQARTLEWVAIAFYKLQVATHLGCFGWNTPEKQLVHSRHSVKERLDV